MNDDTGPGPFDANGPAPAAARRSGSPADGQNWKALHPAARLAIVDRALRAA